MCVGGGFSPTPTPPKSQSLKRAVVTPDEEGPDRYRVCFEGTGLLEVMGNRLVNGAQTKSNHIMETLDVRRARALASFCRPLLDALTPFASRQAH